MVVPVLVHLKQVGNALITYLVELTHVHQSVVMDSLKEMKYVMIRIQYLMMGIFVSFDNF